MSNHSVETVTTSADKARLVVALIAVLAGVIGFYLLAGQTTLVRAAALVGGLLVAIAVAGFVVWTHRANIERLRAGTEPRLGAPGGPPRGVSGDDSRAGGAV